LNKQQWKKNTVLFLGSQTMSLFGSSLVQYAIMWYITLETKSGVMMTISIICGFLPVFFLSPFAGVWADRYNRKMIIVLSDSMIAFTTLILAILFLIGYDMIWLLFVASGIRAIGTAVQMPAVGAFLPQIVPEEKLTRVNGINASVQAMVMLVSPMLSGALLTFASIEIIFFVDVVTAAIAAMILLFFLHVPAHNKAKEKQTTGYFADMKEGIGYIRQHRFIMRYFLFCAGFFLFIAPVSFLTPLQVVRSFGDEVWRLTAIEIAFSIGMMGGGAIMAAWGGFRNRIHSMAFACMGVGIGTLALGIVPNFWVYLAVMAAIGITIPIFNTPATVLLQETVDMDFLGRVFSVLSMISSSVMPLGMLFFGPLSDVVRIEWMLVATGLMIAVQAVFLRFDRALLTAGEPLAGTKMKEDVIE
jgi:DHA3 family macrolide efflux protein-like MFS transporter